MNIRFVCISTFESPHYKRAHDYLVSQGIENPLMVNGIHAETFGIKAAKPYMRDNPDGTHFPPDKVVGCALSHYMAFNIMQSHPETDYWFVVEDDVVFVDGWWAKVEQALKDVPPDFDFLYVGSCCCNGRKTKKIKGSVYKVEYPLCTHAYIVASKALPIIIATTTQAYYPIDLALFDFAHPNLNVYTILPSLAKQLNTTLHP